MCHQEINGTIKNFLLGNKRVNYSVTSNRVVHGWDVFDSSWEKKRYIFVYYKFLPWWWLWIRKTSEKIQDIYRLKTESAISIDTNNAPEHPSTTW